MPAILNQKDALRAAEALCVPLVNPGGGWIRRRSVCYLCGNALPPLDFDFKAKTRKEHIIPRGVLGSAPADSRDAYPLVARIHRECDAKYKREFDGLYAAYERTSGSTGAIPRLEARQLAKFWVDAPIDSEGRIVPAVAVAEELETAVWHWVRGLHSLLYSTYVPIDAARHMIPPIDYVSDDGTRGIHPINMRQSTLRTCSAQIVLSAEKQGIVDGLSAWGGRVQYRCAWVGERCLRSERRRVKRPMCYWLLQTPNLPMLTEALQGDSLPWAGCYAVPIVPPQTQALSTPQFADNAFDFTIEVPRLLASLAVLLNRR